MINWNINNIINRVLVLMALLLYAIVMLTGCRTHSSVQEHRREQYADTAYKSHHVADSLSRYHAMVDSMEHVIRQKDSLVEKTRESMLLHTGSSAENWTLVKDSMSFEVDSMGVMHYHYWHNSSDRSVTHDTVYSERIVEKESCRVTELEDSVSQYRHTLDSVLMSYVTLDSMYRSMIADRESEYTEIKEKGKTWIEKLKGDISSLILSVLLISIITYFIVSKFKKE